VTLRYFLLARGAAIHGSHFVAPLSIVRGLLVRGCARGPVVGFNQHEARSDRRLLHDIETRHAWLLTLSRALARVATRNALDQVRLDVICTRDNVECVGHGRKIAPIGNWIVRRSIISIDRNMV